jgi:hypothetical protein
MILASLALGAGCSSDDGGDAALLAAFPSEGFAGRTIDVVLVGEDTGWMDGASPDFGEGVTVDAVEVVGTGALLVTITIAPNATAGARTVTVTGAGASAELMDAFMIDTPIEFTARGSVAQGSLSIVTITNKDMASPFDTTSTGDGLFTPIEYPNFALDVPAGMDAIINTVQPYSAEVILLVDVNTAAGAAELTVDSGASSLGSLEVTARTAMPLTSGTPATGTVAQAYDSVLYELTPAQFSLINLALSTTSETAAPAIALLPASGAFADLIQFSAGAQSVGDAKFYAVVWENAGEAGYDYTLSPLFTAATKVAEGDAPNETSATAVAVAALPGVVDGAALSAVTDEDWFEVTVAAGDVGKALHVVTMDDVGGTDTVVEVFRANGATSVGGPSDDLGIHEDWTTPALTNAGTYYVKISASVEYFDPMYTAYDAIIELVTAPAP